MSSKQILPRDISTKEFGEYDHAFASYFGQYEMEIVAILIVKLCSNSNTWIPFSYSDMLTLNSMQEYPESRDNVLIGWEFLRDREWIVQDKGSYFKVSPEFIERCKQKSDARLKEKEKNKS